MNNEVPSDTELLELARRFDDKALALIYDLYSPGLYRYAMRLLNDQDLAEDCVAETFSRLLHALQAKRGPDNFLQAYLYRMTHNWISDHYRQAPVQPMELVEEVHDQGPGPEEESGLRMRREHLRSALQKLTSDQRQVIALKYLEGWENEAIARVLHKPVGAVKSLQHRALAALQKAIDREDYL